MQLAAYVDQLDLLGVPRSPRVQLLWATAASASTRSTTSSLSSSCGARAWPPSSPTGVWTWARETIAWGDPRGELGVVACGRCATCDAEVVASRDLLLVAGMRPVQRERLRAAGVTTIEQPADAPAGPQA
ncbi:hypothetical protein [Microbacterium timonense]|uniref:hypothetical protein n=1 Tax=Microbacterium timonense TaxID=2086576 RepID=UPI001F255658|nr:hypothetical protein [Microbacterium timonense]